MNIQPRPPCIRQATYRNRPEEFQVDEVLGFEPTGAGEHLLLHVEKRGANTRYIAAQLAKWAGITGRAVGYCGLKDRHAVTRQWFSLWLPGGHMPASPFACPEAGILHSTWHQRKLPTGAHQSNRFCIVLRQLVPVSSWDDVEQSLEHIARCGVPNYFGAQRFGHKGGNVERARAWFTQQTRVRKSQQGMLLSAARAAVFNRILAQRVAQNTWDTPLPDDVFNLNGSNSVFAPAAGIDAELRQRCAEGDIHPTGALWGRAGKTLPIPQEEERIVRSLPVLSQGLQAAGAVMARRSLRLMPRNMQWVCQHDEKKLTLHFELPRGGYATSVLAALGAVQNMAEAAAD